MAEQYDDAVKWSRNLKRRLKQGRRERFAATRIVNASYRPYVPKYLYQSSLLIDEAGYAEQMFGPGVQNAAICFSDIGSRTDYCVLAIGGLADLHFGASVDAFQQVPRYRFIGGERFDNVTDWALTQFRAKYKESTKRTEDRSLKTPFFATYMVLFMTQSIVKPTNLT